MLLNQTQNLLYMERYKNKNLKYKFETTNISKIQ